MPAKSRPLVTIQLVKGSFDEILNSSHWNYTDWVDLSHLIAPHASPSLPEIPPFCGECGYNMTGLPSNRCPECGTIFDKTQWRERLRQAKELRQELVTANESARMGRNLGGIGLAVAGLSFLLRNSWMGSIVALAAATLGISAAFLGLNVYRAMLVPRWACVVLPQPERGLALQAIILGIVSIVGVMAILID
ncbi:MAG: zinc ribbon domain-containing protein [Planctomycetes bacterium]|nr:zinc ribbon domain-containing protein [Planctomycetota bacterium]MBI3833646.1 zinc ribbon domain-containing protein [Planctomycetota bacterium]